jgi:hypothetical protein
MPSIKLKRTSRYYGSLRTLNVEIDQDKIIPLRYAEEKEIDLPSGTHTLIAKMDWARSLPLSIIIPEGQSKTVVVDTKWLLPALIATFVPPFTVFSLSEGNS